MYSIISRDSYNQVDSIGILYPEARHSLPATSLEKIEKCLAILVDVFQRHRKIDGLQELPHHPAKRTGLVVIERIGFHRAAVKIGPSEFTV